MSVDNAENVTKISELLQSTTDDEEAISIIIQAIAREYDILAETKDDKDAKVATRRLAGLKSLASLLEQRKKLRAKKTLDVESIARRTMAFFTKQLVSVCEDLQWDDTQKHTFFSYFKVKVSNWPEILDFIQNTEVDK